MALDSEPPDQQSRLAHSRAGWLRGAFGRGPAPQFSVVKDSNEDDGCMCRPEAPAPAQAGLGSLGPSLAPGTTLSREPHQYRRKTGCLWD